MSTPNNQPIDHVRFGAIQAAIWKNTDNEGRTRYGVTFERLYRDAEGNWKSTNSFSRDELVIVAKVADRANTRVYELQTVDRTAENGQAPAAANAYAGNAR